MVEMVSVIHPLRGVTKKEIKWKKNTVGSNAAPCPEPKDIGKVGLMASSPILIMLRERN